MILQIDQTSHAKRDYRNIVAQKAMKLGQYSECKKNTFSFHLQRFTVRTMRAQSKISYIQMNIFHQATGAQKNGCAHPTMYKRQDTTRCI